MSSMKFNTFHFFHNSLNVGHIRTFHIFQDRVETTTLNTTQFHVFKFIENRSNPSVPTAVCSSEAKPKKDHAKA